MVKPFFAGSVLCLRLILVIVTGLHFAEICRQVESGHSCDVVKRRQALHHAGEEISGSGFPVMILAAAVPDSDLIDFDILDGLGLELNDFL